MMKAAPKLLPCLLAFMFLSPWGHAREQAAGQTAPGAESGKLVITADNALEWHRSEKYFVALGNAKAVQKGTSIEAHSLKALYKDEKGNSLDLRKIIARDNVVVQTPEAVAYGDNAEYDIASGLAVMRGENLELISEDYTVTAKDRFEYNVAQGVLTAHGGARATSGENALNAETLSATFEERNGERTLEKIEAKNNIVVTTPAETVYGDKGIYRAETNTADIYGNVRIERGPNVLEGARAQVNLSTNVSRILGKSDGGAGDGVRVRGTFYPETLQEGQ